MTLPLVIRKKTAAEWTATTYILSAGVIGIETDTEQVKYGDGEHIWSELPYEVAATVAILTKAAIEAVLTGELSSHSHAFNGFAGLSKITVGTVEPTTPASGDLWVDTN